MWFKVGDTGHLTRNQNIFGKRFKANDGLKIIDVDPKRESYVCEIRIKDQVREVELSQRYFVSPEAWARTEELDRKLKELGLG